MSNDITLKISIDGKEANATLKQTDDNVKELYKSFKHELLEVYSKDDTPIQRTLGGKNCLSAETNV